VGVVQIFILFAHSAH